MGPSNISKKTFLIDELRKQAEGKAASPQNTSPNEAQIRSSIDSLLWQIYGWMEEVARYLDTLHPPVAHEFRLGNVLTFGALTLSDSFASYRRQRFEDQDLLEYIEFFYRLKAPNNTIIRVQSSSADEIETRMRVAGLSFEVSPQINEWKKVHAVQFDVKPEIKSNIRFEPDYIQHKIGIRLANVDRFDAIYLVFPPSQLDEDALEDLVRLVLGEKNTFMSRAPWQTHWRPTKPAIHSYRPSPRYLG
ncbi:MAG: hypothetical protein LBS40_04160 [Burkholderiales bacterium]|jgi:hypothetical protein|nr:hypothetical protein [Burkholderiales bacterium]